MARPTRTAASSSDACPEVASAVARWTVPFSLTSRNWVVATNCFIRSLRCPGFQKRFGLAVNKPFHMRRILHFG